MISNSLGNVIVSKLYEILGDKNICHDCSLRVMFNKHLVVVKWEDFIQRISKSVYTYKKKKKRIRKRWDELIKEIYKVSGL